MATKSIEREPPPLTVGVKPKASDKIMTWLYPADKLEVVASKDFGRRIESSIRGLKAAGRPLGLRLRNQFAAVVIGNDEYEELLRFKESYAALVLQSKQNDIATAGNEFDELFARIASPQTANAFKSIRLASTEDLAAAFKPGGTETN